MFTWVYIYPTTWAGHITSQAGWRKPTRISAFWEGIWGDAHNSWSAWHMSPWCTHYWSTVQLFAWFGILTWLRTKEYWSSIHRAARWIHANYSSRSSVNAIFTGPWAGYPWTVQATTAPDSDVQECVRECGSDSHWHADLGLLSASLAEAGSLATFKSQLSTPRAV